MFAKLLIAWIRGYQKYISPALAPRCRYYPTCSQYTLVAIQTHGAIKGVLMGLARILRCHPFVKGGIDHVPTSFSLKRNTKIKNSKDEYL